MTAARFFKCLQTVKKLDFHSSAARFFDFRHIEKVKLFGVKPVTVTFEYELYSVRNVTERNTAVTAKRLGSCSGKLAFNLAISSLIRLSVRRRIPHISGKTVYPALSAASFGLPQ